MSRNIYRGTSAVLFVLGSVVLAVIDSVNLPVFSVSSRFAGYTGSFNDYTVTTVRRPVATFGSLPRACLLCETIVLSHTVRHFPKARCWDEKADASARGGLISFSRFSYPSLGRSWIYE